MARKNTSVPALKIISPEITMRGWFCSWMLGLRIPNPATTRTTLGRPKRMVRKNILKAIFHKSLLFR